MKLLFKLSLLLFLNCQSEFYSQTLSKEDKSAGQNVIKNSKGLKLKIEELNPIHCNEGGRWAVNAILTNNTHDTLFYFTTSDFEVGYYLAYTSDTSVDLFIDLEKCTASTKQQTVIMVPPSGKRAINLEIVSKAPIIKPTKFSVILESHRAEKQDERIPHYELMRKREREIFLRSNKLTLMPSSNQSIKK